MDSIFMADAVAEAPVETEVAAPSKVIVAAGEIASVRKSIDNLTEENFSATLASIEPFLLNEAGASFYAKSMRRIARNAKALGVSLPEGYAKEARATLKKREKQDAFIKVKEEERLAAEEEARAQAEAAAAEALAAAEATEAAAAAVEEEEPTNEETEE